MLNMSKTLQTKQSKRNGTLARTIACSMAFTLMLPSLALANDGKAAYTVKSGDTLAAIAQANYTDADLIAAMNNMPENAGLTAGQTIYLPLDPEMEVEVASGDNIWSLAKAYNTTATNLIYYNKLEDPEHLKLGQKILVPVLNADEEPQGIAAQAVASRGASLQQRMELLSARTQTVTAKASGTTLATKGIWSSPLNGPITSAFGQRKSGYHHGTDIAADTGTKYYAAAAGTVTFAGYRNSIYGNAVIVDHGNGWRTVYAHSSKVLVKEGDKVTNKTALGLVGSTGNATGPHLHLELHKDDTVLNPMKYIPINK